MHHAESFARATIRERHLYHAVDRGTERRVGLGTVPHSHQRRAHVTSRFLEQGFEARATCMFAPCPTRNTFKAGFVRSVAASFSGGRAAQTTFIHLLRNRRHHLHYREVCVVVGGGGLNGLSCFVVKRPDRLAMSAISQRRDERS
jgi:hypothetical protein